MPHICILETKQQTTFFNTFGFKLFLRSMECYLCLPVCLSGKDSCPSLILRQASC